MPTVRVATAGGKGAADSGEAAAGAGSEEETCPVCLEQFNVVFKQVKITIFMLLVFD